MKIIVPVKRVIDYNVKPRVKPDGTGVDLANVKMSMNPFDEIAVEEALRLREKGVATEVIAVSVGPDKAQETLRTALAMGADRAILVVAEDVEPLGVAKILAKIMDEEQPGLVILGKQAIDDDSNQTGQMLAALTGRPQGTFASKVEVSGDSVSGNPRSRWRQLKPSLKTPAIVTTDLAPERTALCVAAEYHEGKVQAAGAENPCRLWRGRLAASEDFESHRTACA
jgi:electron transfer flavoprotein beta subunit